LHQALLRTGWIKTEETQWSGRWVNLLVIHLQNKNANFLRFTYNQDVFELPVKTPQEGSLAMKRIRDDFRNLQTYFPAADFKYFTDKNYEDFNQPWALKNDLGFQNPLIEEDAATALRELQEGSILTDNSAIDDLSLGNFLATLFDDPSYIPKTESEIVRITEFFTNDFNFSVGFFGNFKRVLKSLTTILEKLVLEDSHVDLIPRLAACLGAGYGRVDAYLSKGHLIPLSVLEQSSDLITKLAKLEELGGRAYPSLATAQYLSRKGSRLLSFIEANCSKSTAIQFKLNALDIADQLDECSSKFANYQILVNRIIYSYSMRKLISGRKVEIPNNADFESLAKEFVSDLSEDDKSLVSRWVESIPGNNPSIIQLAFEISQEVGSSFSTNQNTIRALSLSSSQRSEAFLVNLLIEDPGKLGWLDSSTYPKFLAKLPEDVIDKTFEQLYYLDQRNLFSNWTNFCSDKQLSPIEVRVSKKFLESNLGFGADLFKLLLMLASQTQFEPLSDWAKVISVANKSDAEQILVFLGLTSKVDGLFNVLKKPSKAVIEIYAKDLAAALNWNPEWQWGVDSHQIQVNESLGTLLNSDNDNFKSLALTIIGQQLIHTSQINNFYLSLNNPKILFEMFKDILQTDDPSPLQTIMLVLAQEEKRVFWRMFGAEVEKLLEGKARFAAFFWNNIEQMPPYIIETLSTYSWLPDKVRAEISPSSMSKLTENQKSYLSVMFSKRPDFLEDKSLLRAVLIAPAAQINQHGAAYVRQNQLFEDFWLLMLESNLPVTSKAALAFLDSEVGSKEFDKKIMMALDSNNKFARSSALRILKSSNSPKLLAEVMQKLAENRNQDTWELVAKNMNLIEEAKNLQKFTRRVFLSRRQARAQKEQVKDKIAILIRDLSEVVDKDILVRMSLGSVAKDREWALRQLAQSGLSADDVKVEFVWKEEKNV